MSDFTERQWARGGRASRARAEAVRAPIRRAVAAAAEKGLGGVEFASGTAAEMARAWGLSWASFEGIEPSSARGYTATDVRKIAGVGANG